MTTAINKITLKYIESESTLFLDSDWIVNPDMSAVEGVPSKYWKMDNGSVVEMSQAEKDAIDNDALVCARDKKYKQIDDRTQELIAEGFLFDGLVFSLSTNAQIDWNTLETAVTSGKITEADFPYEVSTKDNNFYMVAWEDFDSLILTALGTVTARLHSGRAFKKLVGAATTAEEVEAIIDTR